jgi:hypothetical protein
MQSIKPHTHQERTQIIEKLTAELQQTFGDNLIALAVEGSYARNEDKAYSDLELTAFLKTKEGYEDWEIRRIDDGQLIVIVAETKESYIRKYLEVTDIWYATGSYTILPIINEEFIKELNEYKPTDLEVNCRKQVEKRWPHFQEITSKILNSIESNDQEGFAMSFYPLVKEMLVIMAYLNCKNYTTLTSYISQAREFAIKPVGFEELVGLFLSRNNQDLNLYKETVMKVFESLEEIT